jgi:hypothetical protein
MTTERLQIADPRMRRSSTICNQRVSRTVGEICYHYQTQRRNDFNMYRYLLVIILMQYLFCVFVGSFAVLVCDLIAHWHSRVKFVANLPLLRDFVYKRA